MADAQAYNDAMKHALPFKPRALLLLAALLLHILFAAQAAAQADAQPAQAAFAAAAPAGRANQSIQRIRVEDAFLRIDEVRVGGQTQSITVQPKTGTNLPAYEVKPADAAGGAALSSSRGETTGSRVWNVLKF